ncbi:hypothetical protein EIN_249830, partial [Entamoeba invadens IP1]
MLVADKTLRKDERERKQQAYWIEPSRVMFGEFPVDSFKYRTTMFEHYFLSHFHSDHYGGITKTWKHGIIVGTE